MNIRGQCINGVKMCFKTTFENDKYCKLGCQTDDNIEHIFVCEKLKHLKGSSFKAAFKSVNEQKEAVAAFMLRIATRTGFLEATQALLVLWEVLEGPLSLHVNKIIIT